MRVVLLLLAAILSLPLASVAAAQTQAPFTPRPASKSTADHSKFEILNGPFASGPEVTKACLTCHTEASKQVHNSIHWTWAYDNPATGQKLGKKVVVNSFCGNLATNEPRCTSCHAGYGWKDGKFDFASQANVDCLVCHEQTGTYKKAPAGAGNPPATPIKFGKETLLPPDWSKVAKSVGAPSRDNCGACHFFGGGGDGVKHGDLDSSLSKPSKALDVHMDSAGLNFPCEKCHVSDAHRLAGSRYLTTAKDTQGASHRGAERNAATCESCHGGQPHKKGALFSFLLNSHVDKIACATCHIPAMARGGKPTKTLWDWSTAGKLKDGKPYVEKDAAGHETYASIKGSFRWEENVVPTYKWFDGAIRYTLVDEKIDPSSVVSVNKVVGGYDDPKSRIWPFKAMQGRQAYDKVHNTLVYTNVFGQNDTAYWTNFDWAKAIEAGQKAAGQPYSGQHGFVDTVMYWPLTHMVAPKENPVHCSQCHARNGRLAALGGFYMPGRDTFGWLDWLGYLGMAAALLGVLGHGAARIFMRKSPAGG